MIDSSPAVSSDGNVYVGSDDNNVYCVASCELVWSYSAADHIESSPSIGSDGRLFIGSFDNVVYCFADPTATPTVTPIPPPPLVIEVEPDPPAAGQPFTLHIMFNRDIVQPFDFYLFAVTPAGIYTIDQTGSIKKGIYAILKNAPLLDAPAIMTVHSSTDIPPDMEGQTIIFYAVVAEEHAFMTADKTVTVGPPLQPLVIEPGRLRAGQPFSLGIALSEDITRPFDFFLLAEDSCGVWTIRQDGSVKRGIHVLYRNVPRFNAPFSMTIDSTVRLPASMAGKTVAFYAVVVEAGRVPPVWKPPDLTPSTPYVIMMDKASATVNP